MKAITVGSMRPWPQVVASEYEGYPIAVGSMGPKAAGSGERI